MSRDVYGSPVAGVEQEQRGGEQRYTAAPRSTLQRHPQATGVEQAMPCSPQSTSESRFGCNENRALLSALSTVRCQADRLLKHEVQCLDTHWYATRCVPCTVKAGAVGLAGGNGEGVRLEHLPTRGLGEFTQRLMFLYTLYAHIDDWTLSCLLYNTLLIIPTYHQQPPVHPSRRRTPIPVDF
jgi:hypothetical protein